MPRSGRDQVLLAEGFSVIARQNDDGAFEKPFWLQLVGTGTTYEDFTWSGPSPDSFAAVNDGQDFDGSITPRTTIFVNEIHYDNVGTDAG